LIREDFGKLIIPTGRADLQRYRWQDILTKEAFSC
jgi:hypothetical protein